MQEGMLKSAVRKRSVLQAAPHKKKTAFCAQTVADAPEDGALAVVRAANRLYENGLKPSGITLTALLPQRISELEIRCLMRSIAAAAGAQDTVLSDSQLSVSASVSRPVVSVTAYASEDTELVSVNGNFANGAELLSVNGNSANSAEPFSASVVQAGFAGMTGSLLLEKYRKEELLTRYTEEFLSGCEAFRGVLSIRETADTAYRLGATVVREAYEGGIFGALWELGEELGTGMEIWLPKILLRQETIEICEFFDCSPYQLLSGGCSLIVSKDPGALIEALRGQGILAAQIGCLKSGNDRILCNHEEKRYLEPAGQDEYYRIMGNR